MLAFSFGWFGYYTTTDDLATTITKLVVFFLSIWFLLGFSVFFVCCWLLALKVAFAKEARTHNLTLNNLQYEMIQKKGKNYVLIKLCFNYFSTLLHIKKKKGKLNLKFFSIDWFWFVLARLLALFYYWIFSTSSHPLSPPLSTICIILVPHQQYTKKI